LEVQHQKVVDNFKEEVARLTSLLEQALRDKSGKATHIAQPEPMPVNPHNMGANGLSFEFHKAMHFQPTYPTRMSFTIDSIDKESQKSKMVKEDGLNKLVALEQRLRAFEGIRLYVPIKAAEMCLVPNVVIPKKFKVSEFVKYTGIQCPITYLKAYCNKMAEVVDDEKLLNHFFSRQLE
jgi:hypothetical protein